MITDSNSKLGSELHADDKRYVLASYVNRFTAEHTPGWARAPRLNGAPYKPQFASDNEWLANTRFAVRKNGRLDRRAWACHGTPTWPNGI